MRVHLLHGKRDQEQRLQKISAIDQAFQTTANTQDHTTPQHLITATQGPQPLNIVIINTEDLHPLISHQEIAAIVETGAVQDLQEAHHLQADQVEEAAHLQNQEEEDKL